jgi:hypothetical protein
VGGTLTAKAITVESGTGGTAASTEETADSGAGGAASLTAETLTAQTINLKKNNGDFNVNVGMLNVTGQDTTLNLNGTSDTDVIFTAINIGGGQKFIVTRQNSGDYAFGKLTVSGVGATYSDTLALDVTGYKELNYIVPQTASAGDTLLQVSGTSGAKIGANTSVSIAYASGRSNIAVDQYLILLNTTSGALNSTDFVESTIVHTPTGDVYELKVINNQQLQAILKQLSPTSPAYERLKAYAESRLASLAFANQGVDFLLNRGFGSALDATAGSGLRKGVFGGVSGGRSRYETGSHIDVSGASFLAGAAFGSDVSSGRLTLGAFFETGRGGYDSHNTFNNAAPVDGKGDTDYTGAGLLARYDLTSGPLEGLYLDASARAGRTKLDFRTDDIQYNGWKAEFDTASPYYGLHGGVGYVLPTA